VLLLFASVAFAQPVVIKTTTLIDGKGRVLRNQEITVESGRITRIANATHKPDIDLSGLTVTPGWIDTHAHPGWYFNKEDRLEQGGRGAKSTPQQAALFSLNMLVSTDAGSNYNEFEYTRWMKDAGFTDVCRINLPAPSSLIVGQVR
jgi:imidazolonepropionase-like amidohydrolase